MQMRSRIVGGSRPRRIFIYEHITGGGMAGVDLPESLAREGSAMRRSLAREFSSVEGLAATVALDARLETTAGRFEVAHIDEVNRTSAIERLANASDLTLVVAPETDDVLASLVESLSSKGATLLNSTPEAVRVFGDKLRTSELWRSMGLPHPRAQPFGEGAFPNDSMHDPVVMKPRFGAGGTETCLVENRHALRNLSHDSQSMILQEYVCGIPMSANFLIARSGEAVLLCSGIQNIGWRASRFEYLGGTLPVPTPPEAVGVLEAAVKSFSGLEGLVGVDYVWNPDSAEVALIELNPRVTTSFVAMGELLPPGSIAHAWLEMFEHGDCSQARALSETLAKRSPTSFVI